MSKPVSKQALYSMISSRAKEVIERVAELTKSDNESVALGACKLLLNKALPDLKGLALERVEAIDAETNSSLIEIAEKLERQTKSDFRLGGTSISKAKQIISEAN